MFCRTRSGRLNLRRLDTSNGCQDHTALPSALAPFVSARVNRSRVEPALRSRCAPALPRPPHPVPNVRDDRDTPLSRDGMAADIEVIWVSGEQEYFCKRGWTGKSARRPSGKSLLQ